MSRIAKAVLALVVLSAGLVGVTSVIAGESDVTETTVSSASGDEVARAADGLGKHLIYTALDEPCRLWDTRGGGGVIGSTIPREFSVRDPLTSQGGKSGGCKIPTGAVAMELSISTIGGTPSGVGFLRAGPAGDLPKATVLQFLAGQGTSVTTTVKLDAQQELVVQPFSASVGLVGDGIGFWERRSHAILDMSSGTAVILSSSNLVGAEIGDGVGHTLVTFERASSDDCAPAVTPMGVGSLSTVDGVNTSATTVTYSVRTVFRENGNALNHEFSIISNC